LSYLAAFQEAEPYLGLPPQAYKLVAWLVKQTMAQDWEEGSRPICWPSAARQAEFLGLSPSRVKILNRVLFEAGIFIVRDSGTGKRYGRRDQDNRIIEAFGFDLSPLAFRFDEFIRLAAEARSERERMRGLKGRATRARRAIRQIGETLAELHARPAEWPQLEAETASLVASIRRAGRSEELALVVKGLESRKLQAEDWLRELSNVQEINPEGPVSEPHTISTNKPFELKDTVVASNGSSQGLETNPPTPSSGVSSSEALEDSVTFRPFERVEQIHPGELLELAPRLAELIPGRFADWGDIVDAAGSNLRHELGVSQPLWGEACLVLGRQLAAVALAIVSTKPKDHFSRGAGGYFAAMVKRAEKGELHLDRSLWKLRRDKWSDNRQASKAVRAW
jgi:replication initiation protein RepC